MDQFQQYFSYIVAVSFIGGGNQLVCPEKNTDLSQVTDKTLSHNVVLSIQLAMSGIRTDSLIHYLPKIE